MLSRFYNFLWEKLPFRSEVGQKRRADDAGRYTPRKMSKLDTQDNPFESKVSQFPERVQMQSKENQREEDDCSVVAEIYGSRHHLGAQKRRSLPKLNKAQNEAREVSEEKPCIITLDDKDVEVVDVIKNDLGGSIKNKSKSKRIFTTTRMPLVSHGKNRKEMFKSSLGRIMNCRQECYRLEEKFQYYQLLQSHTVNKLPQLLAPFKIARIHGRRGEKTSIPVVDLTEERVDVNVNRDLEVLPRTSSSLEDAPDVEILQEIPRVNSLMDILRKNSLTEKDIGKEILSNHSERDSTENRLVPFRDYDSKILSDCNRKDYNDALEERLRSYMKITERQISEFNLEESYNLPELTADQERKITSALKSSSESKILVEKFGLQIKKSDMETLKGLNWLNDEVINFYMNLIMERSSKNGKLPKTYAFNTFFYSKLMSGGYTSLKRWTKKVDIFCYDIILIPVHLGMHWCLAIIDFRCKEVRYYDSMGSTNDRCLGSLLYYLEAESEDKKKIKFNTSDWEQINVDDIPQQMNGSDCGVFSCMFAEHLARDSSFLFSQENMPYFRRKMVLEILQGELIT